MHRTISVVGIFGVLAISLVAHAKVPERSLPDSESPALRFDGLYEAKRSLANSYVRFYEDGTLCKLSQKSIDKAAPLIAKPCWYKYTISGTSIEVVFEPRGTVEFTGTIGNNQITLRSRYGEELDYRFIELDFATAQEKAAKEATTLPEFKGKETGKTFIIVGQVTFKGKPLTGRTIVASPIDPKTGRALTKFVPVGGLLRSINPQTKTDNSGKFSIEVPYSLFDKPSGRCSLGIFEAAGGGQLRSSLQPVIVEFDSSTERIDLGVIRAEPLK